ncbi:MAG TPA: hypothetical protein DCE41_33735 [Cytophagales bacterium]|nr:hypothetical protein [Cytophagales bacterium]HAA19305.1 hypothetical protein [Cytophagales bacterium]HAP60084.1 hypothetical protein [Cytophagales bacterium]
MARTFLATLILLILSTSLVAAQSVTVTFELVCQTDGVQLHHNDRFVKSLTFQPGRTTTLYQTRIKFRNKSEEHIFTLSRPGHETKVITIPYPEERKSFRHYVKLEPNPPLVNEPWDFTLHVAKSAFAVEVDKLVAIFSTVFDYSERSQERIYGSDVYQLDYLLARIPLALDRQLVQHGIYLPDSLRPEERPEAFFMEEAPTPGPQVILGVKVIDLLVKKSQSASSGLQSNHAVDVTLRWYLFDPVTQKVVYQNDSQGVFKSGAPYRLETLEQAFTYAVGQAFDQLIFDPQFIAQARRLGQQAVQQVSTP